MARTNSDDVKKTLLADYSLDQPDLDIFIARAGRLVDRVATCATAKGKTLTDEELADLECLLAAHFYTAGDKPLASRSTAGSSGSFQGQTGMHLDSTRYGQDAKLVDVSGCLASLAARSRIGAFWVGTRPSQQTPYSQRS